MSVTHSPAPASRPVVHHPVVTAGLERKANDIQVKIAVAITTFAGSMLFVYIHIVVFAAWMLFIEKSPWQTLTLIVSLEAIFLSTFVMIGQNRVVRVPASQSRPRFHRAGARTQNQHSVDPGNSRADHGTSSSTAQHLESGQRRVLTLTRPTPAHPFTLDRRSTHRDAARTPQLADASTRSRHYQADRCQPARCPRVAPPHIKELSPPSPSHRPREDPDFARSERSDSARRPHHQRRN